MSKTAALAVLLAVVGGSLAEDYCKFCEDHTMCQYTQDPGPKCGPVEGEGVTRKQRQEIVDVHNELRAKVAAGLEMNGTNGAQPPASNMRKLSWDSELAKVAQRWAAQCDWGHDTCRHLRRFSYGQNFFVRGTGASAVNATWRATVENWYSEVNKFNKDYVSPFKYVDEDETGHYTQVAWAETYKVGCGFIKYKKDTWLITYYVCNYGPPGNVGAEGVDMYVPGVACSGCPDKTRCDGGLCA